MLKLESMGFSDELGMGKEEEPKVASPETGDTEEVVWAVGTSSLLSSAISWAHNKGPILPGVGFCPPSSTLLTGRSHLHALPSFCCPVCSQLPLFHHCQVHFHLSVTSQANGILLQALCLHGLCHSMSGCVVH
jgi:hypothetical protein